MAITDTIYDSCGNLISETKTIGGISYTTQYTYDVAERLKTVTYTRNAIAQVESASVTIDGVTQTLVPPYNNSSAKNSRTSG